MSEILQIIGECNNCGKCCLDIKSGGFMLENPCITREEDRCKFYTDILNKDQIGHCLIQYGLSKGITIEEIKDDNGNIINKEQIKWFYENCPGYPTFKDAELGIELIDGCGFTIIK